MSSKFVIMFYSPVINKQVYFKEIIENRIPSEDLLNYTEDINKAVIFKKKEDAIIVASRIKLYFNHTDKTITIKDITKYTKYNRFEIMDI